MPDARPYYSDRGLSAPHYDAVTARDASLAGDIDLYAGLAPVNGRVLELGAGTGRVALALAEQGFTVVGVDLSPAMLAQAEAKRAALRADAAARVSFRRGDMASLRLERSFHAVICPFFGLAHLPAGAAWRNVFDVIARHVEPGGRAAIHLPAPEALAGAGPAASGTLLLSHPLDDGRTLKLILRQRRFRADIGRFDQVLDYVVEGPSGQAERRSSERLTYYAADPRPYAEAAGLVPDREPVDLGGVGAVHIFRRA